jgi:hypothetical protein
MQLTYRINRFNSKLSDIVYLYKLLKLSYYLYISQHLNKLYLHLKVDLNIYPSKILIKY